MTSVFIRDREKIQTKRGRPCEDRGRDYWDSATKNIGSYQILEEARNGSIPENSPLGGGSFPWRKCSPADNFTLDFRPPEL